MQTFNMYEAKTNFSKIVALVQKGEKVVIAKNGKPLVDMHMHMHVEDDSKQKRKIAFGSMAGKLHYNDENFSGLDPDIQEMFYGKDWDKQ